MIKNFFLALNQTNIKYMLISGQATILYGAATFSEDIDLWVSPETKNWQKFIQCLRKSGAKAYKVTPPLKPEFIQKGHGFHFEFSATNKEAGWFLDVMGVVPRVGTFQKAWKNVEFYKTGWGRLPVIGLRDLVEIKKTRRLQDYPIISNLVRNEYERIHAAKIKDADWKWILVNSFETEDILYYLKRHKNARKICETLPRKYLVYCLKAIKGDGKEEKYFSSASKEIAFEIERLRRGDRIYWRAVINELKKLNREKKLLNIGSIPVFANRAKRL